MTEQATPTQSKNRLTDEYLAMTPAQKWDCLLVNGLIGTDEPWIEDMRSALKAQDARIASQAAEIERLREALERSERLHKHDFDKLQSWVNGAGPKITALEAENARLRETLAETRRAVEEYWPRQALEAKQ